VGGSVSTGMSGERKVENSGGRGVIWKRSQEGKQLVEEFDPTKKKPFQR